MQSVYDLPIGVARTNTLLRVTVIADEKGFETPLLLPVTCDHAGADGSEDRLRDRGVPSERWEEHAHAPTPHGSSSNICSRI